LCQHAGLDFPSTERTVVARKQSRGFARSGK
jgi:hypothetical protein